METSTNGEFVEHNQSCVNIEERMFEYYDVTVIALAFIAGVECVPRNSKINKQHMIFFHHTHEHITTSATPTNKCKCIEFVL